MQKYNTAQERLRNGVYLVFQYFVYLVHLMQFLTIKKDKLAKNQNSTQRAKTWLASVSTIPPKKFPALNFLFIEVN